MEFKGQEPSAKAFFQFASKISWVTEFPEPILSVFLYLIIVGAVVLVVRFFVGFYYTTRAKPWLKETTVIVFLLIVLPVFSVFLIILQYVEIELCRL